MDLSVASEHDMSSVLKVRFFFQTVFQTVFKFDFEVF